MLDEEHSQSETAAETSDAPLRKSTRTRNMPSNLEDCILNRDDEVTDDGDLVHLAFGAEAEPVNF
ncbi:hypothetical protein A2U01_0093764, partial [Trifolium medium]|nr:hypothetical protein [Trifolium medium]